MVYVSGHIDGVMNDFYMKNVGLVDQNSSNIRGLFHFKNVFDKEKPFWMNAKLLSDKLPAELSKLGSVDIVGDIEMTKRTLNTNINMLTSIGKGKAVIEIENLDNPDLAAYKGNVVLEQFDLGGLIGNDNFGVTSLDLDIDGVGFNQ